MSTGNLSNTANRKRLRLGWMSGISFLLATALMWPSHEWALWGSFGFAFMGIFLSFLELFRYQRPDIFGPPPQEHAA